MTSRKKVGLALGSGGVRGLAHIGVLKTLLKHNIPIDYLAGSSIGSWVAAHFSLYGDIKKTEDFTVGKKKEKFLSFLEPNMSGGLVKGAKIEILLNEWLGGSSFSDLKIPLKIVTTNLISGEKVIFTEGKLAPVVRASMAVPGLFKPVIINSQSLVDGGISDPVPVDLLKESGAEIVIAVNLDFFSGLDNISPEKIGYMNVAEGTINIMRHYLAKYSCYGADFIIEPSLKNYSSWSGYFMKNTNDEDIIRLAEEETEKIIPALKEKIFKENND